MDRGTELQREYYARTALKYESMHVRGDGEHDLACALIHGLAVNYNVDSILDIGSGTGRAVLRLGRALPGVKVMGVEPVEALRRVGHANGIPEHLLVEGDATKLDFPDGSFDFVCELGVLHHIPNPRLAVAEMLRVARKGIFISDTNRFGRGSLAGRYAKLIAWRVGLWPMVNWIKTGGRGYDYSEGDGIAYSYSVFDDYGYIQKQCSNVMVLNLDGSGGDLVSGAHHVGLFAVKKIDLT